MTDITSGPITASNSGNMVPRPSILFESEEWLVVDKPAGWHSVEQAAGAEKRSSPRRRGGVSVVRVAGAPTIEAWLRSERPELVSLHESGLVHRLDQPTSGCLLVARKAVAQQALRTAISEEGSLIRKTYCAALRCGVSEEGLFDLFFHGRHRRSSKTSVRSRGEEHERGRCRWRRIEKSVAGDLVEVELIGPGRRHQIRAGFAHLGFPLLGDALYLGDAPLPGLDGPALHAWRLEIGDVRVESPPPGPWLYFQVFASLRTPGSSAINPTITG
ncbi:MAG: RNA pseudouridine synthase [Phycisphaeraceae bacterium]|nr:RNA pseudouridine synthase [Phycisphaeraceae bacterium]